MYYVIANILRTPWSYYFGCSTQHTDLLHGLNTLVGPKTSSTMGEVSNITGPADSDLRDSFCDPTTHRHVQSLLGSVCSFMSQSTWILKAQSCCLGWGNPMLTSRTGPQCCFHQIKTEHEVASWPPLSRKTERAVYGIDDISWGQVHWTFTGLYLQLLLLCFQIVSQYVRPYNNV